MHTSRPVVSAVFALTVLAAAGCGGSKHPAAGSTTSAPTSVTSTATGTTTAAASSASPSTPPAPVGGGRLAYVAAGQMFVQRVAAAGTLVGAPLRAGPADPASQPMWSPAGRYLVWQYFPAGGARPVGELFDSATGHLRQSPGLTGVVTSTGVGMFEVNITSSTHVSTATVTVGGVTTPVGGANFSPQVVAGFPASHDQTIVETGSYTGNTPDPLWLLAPAAAPVRLGQVTPISFLGQTVVPVLSRLASTTDGTAVAALAEQGQDGGCASNDPLHVLDLATHTDVVVTLPLPSGTLKTLTYSPEGVLGAISSNCPSGANTYQELHGTTWTTVVTGATIGTRGPGGLLAVQLGTFIPTPPSGYSATASQDNPLQIRDLAGTVTATLPDSYAAAWTQAAVAPN